MNPPPSIRKRSSVSGRPCTTLLGWYRNQWDALLGVLGVKANCELLFSGRARVVYHDYSLYRYYITTLSAIYLLCPSPRLSILYCRICVDRVEEIQTASLFLLLYRVSAKGSRESSWRLRTDTCISVMSLDNVVHILNPSHSGRSDQPSRTDDFCQVCANRL